MKVSIITVCYNSEEYLSATINSVLNQSYPNIEYIIVDGGSKDSTVNLIKEQVIRFNGRLKWISEPDKGIYDAMNKGIRMASGDIVGILNSDDFFIDNRVVEDIVSSFTDETDAIFGNLSFVRSENIDSVVRFWKGSPYRSFKTGWHPAHPTFYVRRSVYEKYGLFDTSFDVSADFELMLRFIERYCINTKYIDRDIIKMRMGGESTKSIRNIIKGNRNIMRAFKKNDIPVSPFYPILRLAPKVYNVIKVKFKKK